MSLLFGITVSIIDSIDFEDFLSFFVCVFTFHRKYSHCGLVVNIVDWLWGPFCMFSGEFLGFPLFFWTEPPTAFIAAIIIPPASVLSCPSFLDGATAAVHLSRC